MKKEKKLKGFFRHVVGGKSWGGHAWKTRLKYGRGLQDSIPPEKKHEYGFFSWGPKKGEETKRNEDIAD